MCACLWFMLACIFQSSFGIPSKSGPDNPLGIPNVHIGREIVDSIDESDANAWFSIDTPVKVSTSLFDGAIKVAASVKNVSTSLVKESAAITPTLAANISKTLLEESVGAAQFVTNSTVSAADKLTGGFHSVLHYFTWLLIGIGVVAFLIILVFAVIHQKCESK